MNTSTETLLGAMAPKQIVILVASNQKMKEEQNMEMNTNPTREMKKAEAIKWMKILHFNSDAIKEFEENDTVFVCSGPAGDIHEATPEQLKAIQDFERSGENLVYLIVESCACFGHMDSLLFVDNYPEEWEDAKSFLSEGYVFTWTMNLDHPVCSDMGDIFVETTKNGGLVRRF